MYLKYFDILVSSVILASFCAPVSKWMSVERSGVQLVFVGSCSMCMGGVPLTFLVFNVILGSFGPLVPKWPLTRKLQAIG